MASQRNVIVANSSDQVSGWLNTKREITPVRRMTISATTASAASGSVTRASQLSRRADKADLVT